MVMQQVRRDLEDDEQPRLPGQPAGRAASPALSRCSWPAPAFLSHASSPGHAGSCFECGSLLYHTVLLRTFNVQVNKISWDGEREGRSWIWRIIDTVSLVFTPAVVVLIMNWSFIFHPGEGEISDDNFFFGGGVENWENLKVGKCKRKRKKEERYKENII